MLPEVTWASENVDNKNRKAATRIKARSPTDGRQPSSSADGAQDDRNAIERNMHILRINETLSGRRVIR